MLTLLKAPAVAAGVLAATVTGIAFAQAGVSGRWSNQVPVGSSCASL